MWRILFVLLVLTVPFLPAHAATGSSHTCYVVATHKNYPCQVGKSSVLADKKEGDGATPAGDFPIREIFYRADKLSKDDIARLEAARKKGLPVHMLTPDDGWSDDPHSPFYNQHISIADYLKTPLPNPSYEKLWRDDDVYDVVVVIGYNDQPIVKGKGSAIFMHLQRRAANGDIVPTIGCVSFAQSDLMDIIATLTPETYIHIPVQGSMITISEWLG
jgi:L,D-peptidoglycan transpeptidase YkuD (ErfK/YbiS/YcfS/YnhG family)